MLVLSRKKNESIVIDDQVVITIIEVRGDKVRLGIQAPRDVAVHRQEVLDAILSEKVKIADDSTEEQSA
ncbi:MAG: carbon storage regulator CsrA [bacterium]